MAAITQQLIRHRPVHGKQPHPLRLFSSSQSQPSYFTDVKASLRNEPSQQNLPPTLRKPYKPAYVEEIRRNRSAPSPPPFSGPFFDRCISPNIENPPSNADGLKSPFAPTFGSIRESLRHIPFPSPRNQNDSESKTTEQLNLNPDENAECLPRAWTDSMGQILADPDQAETMALRSAARLPLFISSMIQHRADLKEKLSLLEQEKSQLSQDMSLAKNQIVGLKGKLVASSIERDKVEEKIAELGRKVEAMCKEKSDPLKCVNNFSLYSYYLCYFDCIRHLMKAGQPADLLVHVLKDYNTRNNLHSKFSLPILDLEDKYGMDLSWWPDWDQLEEAEEDHTVPISTEKAD